MKINTLKTFALIGLLALAGMFNSSPITAAPTMESAVVEFADTVKLGDILLRGEYLIVHDEERMARGEPCTYIYRGKKIDRAKLVTAFHCIHVQRERVAAFKATISHPATPYGIAELKEIQFAGSTDGHAVP